VTGFMDLVIGGGITGLACAFELLNQGRTVRLIEPDNVGGLVQTKVHEEFLLELGPNLFLLKPHLANLLEKLGLRGDIVEPSIKDYRQYVWYNGRPCSIPRSLLASVTSSLMSPVEKIKVIAGLFAQRPSIELEDESIHAFLGRYIPHSVVKRIVDPALRGIYGGSIDLLSARSIFPQLWQSARGGSSLVRYIREKAKRGGRASPFVLRRGAHSLVSALLNKIPPDVIVKDRVTSVHDRGKHQGFEILCESSSRFSAQHVFVTTSGLATALYLDGIDSALAQDLRNVNYAPIVVVHVAVDRTEELLKDGFGILFPADFPDRLMGIMFNSMLFPHVAPLEKHLLTFCFGGVGHEEILLSSDEHIKLSVERALRGIFSISDFEVMSIHKWPRAVPQLEVGIYKLHQRMDDLEKRCPGLYFLGVDRGGVGVPDRVARSCDCLGT
jgi:protoporphyrinogen/coproporphyrinogen III oxidase